MALNKKIFGRLFRKYIVPRVKFLRELQEQFYLIAESTGAYGESDNED